MPTFFVALGHLLYRSFVDLVFGWMSTSFVAIAVGALNYWVSPYIDRIIHGDKAVNKPRLTGSVVVACATWFLLFGISVIHTIYMDHVHLVSESQSLINQIAAKDQVLRQNRNTIDDLSAKLSALTTQEPNDSLRRRTVKLADEFTMYLAGMLESKKKPPDAFPNSADPNPSEERKKEIQASQTYYQGIEDYYAKHFRDRFVGIVKEYEYRGVRTGYLANEFAQRVPYIPQLGSVMDGLDDISRFRDLAYHVDARDHLITF
jgi:hypothetical protein